ncbi:unnamed protein product, partial [Effrenium voratum]
VIGGNTKKALFMRVMRLKVARMSDGRCKMSTKAAIVLRLAARDYVEEQMRRLSGVLGFFKRTQQPDGLIPFRGGDGAINDTVSEQGLEPIKPPDSDTSDDDDPLPAEVLAAEVAAEADETASEGDGE